MVNEVILKKQVTSYFLEKNITAITKVITDVWRKRVSKEYRSFGPWTRRSIGEPWPGRVPHRCGEDTVAASELAQGCTTNSWMRSDNKHTNHYFQLSDFEEATQIYFSLERRACMARTYRFAAQCQWTRPCWMACNSCDSLRAVIASRFCRTISGLTQVLVRLAMTLHTWSRIVMRCT